VTVARNSLRSLLLVALPLAVPPAGFAAQQSSGEADSLRLRFPTPAEANGYLSFTTPEESLAFLRRLAAVSPLVRLDSLVPQEHSAEEAAAVPFVTLQAPRPASLQAPLRAPRQDLFRAPGPAAVPAPLPIVLVLAAQHGDEPSGLDAALRLVRDVALGDLRPILDHLTLSVVPLVNAAGLAARTREDARGRDLNRDHLRLASPVTAAIHRYFAALRPEMVIDLHELGPVMYDVEIALPTHPDVDPALVNFGRYYLLPYVVNELARRDYTYHDYVEVPGPPEEEVAPGLGPVSPPPDSARATPDSARATPGAARPATDSAWFTPASPDPSHARNAFALEGAVSFLVEVSSTREIDGYEERTNRQYAAARALLEVGAAQADRLATTVADSRARTLEGLPERVILRARPAPDPRQPVLTWRMRGPTGQPVIGESGPWRPRLEAELAVERPAAYVLAPDQEELLGLLLRHGFQVERLSERARLLVGRYPVRIPARRAVGAPAKVVGAEAVGGEPTGAEAAADEVPSGAAAATPEVPSAPIAWEWRVLPAGSLLIRTRQPGGGLLPVLLEPYSEGGWFTGRAELSASGAGGFYPIVRLSESYRGPTEAVRRPAGGGTSLR